MCLDFFFTHSGDRPLENLDQFCEAGHNVIFQRVFIKISIHDTFELTKPVFSGSDQMTLNTLTILRFRERKGDWVGSGLS